VRLNAKIGKVGYEKERKRFKATKTSEPRPGLGYLGNRGQLEMNRMGPSRDYGQDNGVSRTVSRKSRHEESSHFNSGAEWAQIASQHTR